ncbi:MAG: hypothetical protein DME79_06455 [Verrucomicrobia bacterium]|nr:MAG: hypothetical protein DME79_06455 [Verrucomicrobiota bacterium]
MNWANRITLSRLALTLVFVIALNSSWQYARTTALVIFLIAGLTDFIDGEIARRYGLITNFGKLMDPCSIHFPRAAQGRAGVGSDHSRRARFFGYRIASDG